jgi:hypothetical protein
VVTRPILLPASCDAGKNINSNDNYFRDSNNYYLQELPYINFNPETLEYSGAVAEIWLTLAKELGIR